MNFGILVFPGTWSDRDCGYALQSLGQNVEYVWHADRDVDRFDALVVPGGFSYGDYLRAGAIAARSPVMESVLKKASAGIPILGICNGFQVLTECGLLPGTLLRNRDLKFICKTVTLKVATSNSIFTKGFDRNNMVSMPIAHNEGNY